MTRIVKSYKYLQVKKLIKAYELNGLELFDACQVEAGGLSMPVTPPVVEQHGGLFYVVEGNSRLTYVARETDLTHVRVVVVRNVTQPLPSSGKFSVRELIISDIEAIGVDRYDDWVYANYRKIEEYSRPPSFYLGAQ